MALPHLLYAQVNSWTNAPGGKWETGANWSLGVPPASSQSAFVTNAASKTVTIDAITTNAASTMTVSNLTVFAPTAGVTNTVALTTAGLDAPLHVLNTFTIGNGGALFVSNSAMQVDASVSVRTNVFDGLTTVAAGGLVAIATNSVTLVGSTNGVSGTI